MTKTMYLCIVLSASSLSHKNRLQFVAAEGHMSTKGKLASSLSEVDNPWSHMQSMFSFKSNRVHMGHRYCRNFNIPAQVLRPTRQGLFNEQKRRNIKLRGRKQRWMKQYQRKRGTQKATIMRGDYS